jgi:AcrR family transcriptional regulator
VEPGRRERKRVATRAAIEDAAWRLFAERGFTATSVDAIAEHADVAPRTFFRYFPSKDAVLYGDSRALEQAFRDALAARPDDEPAVASFAAALRAIAPLVDGQRDRHLLRRRILSDDRGPAVADRLGALDEKSHMLEELVAERTGADLGEPGVQLLAGLVGTVMAVTYRQWIEAGAVTPLVDVLDATWRRFAELAAQAPTATGAPTGRRRGRPAPS